MTAGAGVSAGTLVGNVASPYRTVVDPSGTLHWAAERSWSLEWWIGAEDRWHVPVREPAVRQHLVEGTPVVETAMRVPGGDAVQRVYAARDGEDEYAVVEIHNQSRVPFAVAFAVLSSPKPMQLSESMVRVGRSTALLLPGRPGYVAAGRDVAQQVIAGDAVPAPARIDRRAREAAFLFPLAHGAVLRAAVPLTGADRRPPVNRLPSAADVARGWQTQTRRGVRLELPAGRLADAVEANRRHLLLLHQGERPVLPEVATALAQFGFLDESAEILRATANRDEVWLSSLAEHWRLTGDERLAESLVAWIARVVNRRKAERQALIDGSDLLMAAGQPEAAEALARRAQSAAPLCPSEQNGLMMRLDQLLDAASPTWTWTDRERDTASFCTLARQLLVRDEPDAGLSIMSELPGGWVGQPVEVHDAPTRAGLLSYAVRWHGQRPALLWELRPRDASRSVRIDAPGLDAHWSTDQVKGDALLGAVEESFR